MTRIYGITFYFHGKMDKDLCLVSDPNLHIYIHFIGKRSPYMTTDFTWVQSIALLFGTHRVYGEPSIALSVNGELILLSTQQGAKWQSPSTPKLTFTRTHATNGFALEVEAKLKIEATVVPKTEEESRVHGYGVTQEDCMAHLNLKFKLYALSDEVSGVGADVW